MKTGAGNLFGFPTILPMRWYVWIVFGGFGLYLFLGGLFSAARRLTLQRKGVRAQGTVLDFEKSGRVVRYHPIAEFRAFDGGAYRFTGSVSYVAEPKKGATVEVIYDPDNPSRADIAGAEKTLSGSLATSVLGLMFLGGLYLFMNMGTLFRQGPGETFRTVVPLMKWACLLVVGGPGLALFLTSAAWGFRRCALLFKGERAQGTIIEYFQEPNTRGVYPVVEFTASDGNTRRLLGSTGSLGSARYRQKGAKVEVVYDRDDKSSAQVSDFEQFWLGPLGVGLLGSAILFMGIFGFYSIRDSERDRAGAPEKPASGPIHP